MSPRAYFAALLLVSLMANGPASAQRPGAASHRRAVDLAAAAALVARVVPASAGAFTVAVIPDSDGLDVFEVESRGGKVVLRGSSGVAIASALERYLENVALPR